jgi:hypothetical protein
MQSTQLVLDCKLHEPAMQLPLQLLLVEPPAPN